MKNPFYKDLNPPTKLIIPLSGSLTMGRPAPDMNLNDDRPKPTGEKEISQIVEETIFIERRPFRYVDVLTDTITGKKYVYDRSYLKKIYDIDAKLPMGCRDMVLSCARQTEKSTTAACKGIAWGAKMDGLKGLYVEPRFSQVSVFSQQRFKAIAEGSPIIAEERLSTKNIWQVSMKEFSNGSFFNFRACYLSADSVRGISADFLNVDEAQDIISDEIAVIEECQSHASPDKFFRMYTGTPKTALNYLNRRYEGSSQYEWMVKCGHCPNWNYLDEKVIGEKFFVCTKCGKEIFPKRCKDKDNPNDFGGEWIAMRPSKEDVRFGFRISQIQVPFRSFGQVREKLLDPNMSFARFQNEVLGLSSAEGELVLTEADVAAACENNRTNWETAASAKRIIGAAPVFMGVDHGTGVHGTDGEDRHKARAPSFTVVSIGAFCGDEKFRILYMEKFLGERVNLAGQAAYINKLAREWGAMFVGSDWGFGAITNDRLINEFGWLPRQTGEPHPIMLEMQYTVQKPVVTFNNTAGVYGRYMIDRSSCMRLLIDAVKKKVVRFPAWKIIKETPASVPFVDDFTSIFVEYDEHHGTMRFDHTAPDDAFQATMLCYLAAKQYYGEFAKTLIPMV